jgi:hypothetical protein
MSSVVPAPSTVTAPLPLPGAVPTPRKFPGLAVPPAGAATGGETLPVLVTCAARRR